MTTAKVKAKKVRKLAHATRMKVRLRSKGKVSHNKTPKPRKRDRILATAPAGKKKSIWGSFKDRVKSKMKARITKREAAEQSKKVKTVQ